MTNSPKVTVIMAAYNSERFLREAIDSILKQTFTDFEFVIVNDASTDLTLQILESYRDPRIRVITNQTNLGLIGSLNKGLSLARGQYIARQDDDDISLPARLEKEVELLDRSPKLGLVGTYFRIINELGVVVQDQPLPVEDEDIRQVFSKRNCLAHGSVMFRTECVKKAGNYRMEFKHCEDFDLWLRISQHFECRNIPEYLYLWRLKVASISFTHRFHQNELTRLAIEFYKERLKRTSDPVERGEWTSTVWLDQLNQDTSRTRKAKIQSLHYQGFSFLLNDRSGEALQAFFKALVKNPINLTSWFWVIMCGFRVLLPFHVFCRFLEFFLKRSPGRWKDRS